MKEEKLTPEILEKINKRTEFKIRMDMIDMWAAAIKDPEDFRLFLTSLNNFCRNLEKPNFEGAKDPKLLNTLFKLESAKQRGSAICYAKMCIKNTQSGRKGGEATAKRTLPTAKRTRADKDYDLGLGSDIDIEDIDIDIEQESDRPSGPALTGVPPAEEGIVLLPENFWDEEE